jgi:hypothetical protein
VGLARSRRARSRSRTHAPLAAIELATGLADLLRQQPQYILGTKWIGSLSPKWRSRVPDPLRRKRSKLLRRP